MHPPGKENKKPAAISLAAGLGLFGDMAVVADMLLAVAVIALAPGAVAELQLRVGQVRTAAYGATVGIWSLGRGDCGLVGTGRGEGDDLGPGSLGVFFLNSRRKFICQEMGITLMTSLPKNRK